MKDKRIELRVSQEQYNDLNELSKKNKKSKSKIITLLIEKEINSISYLKAELELILENQNRIIESLKILNKGKNGN